MADFGLLRQPRTPTKEELTKGQKYGWLAEAFPKLVSKGGKTRAKLWKVGTAKFTILAEDLEDQKSQGNYNCLGWVMQNTRDYRSFTSFKNVELAKLFKDKLGYVECTADKAVIDVWYQRQDFHELDEGYAEHVSLLKDGQWTSKLGDVGAVIAHKRDGLEGDDYGKVRKHFGPA